MTKAQDSNLQSVISRQPSEFPVQISLTNFSLSAISHRLITIHFHLRSGSPLVKISILPWVRTFQGEREDILFAGALDFESPNLEIVLVNYCHVTNHPKTQWLKMMPIVCYLSWFLAQDFEKSSAGQFWLEISHVVTFRGQAALSLHVVPSRGFFSKAPSGWPDFLQGDSGI